MAKVSIVMPLYNAKEFVGEAIDSVLAQSHTDWELLVVDDCSNDGSVQIVREYAEADKRIRLFCLDQNSGPAVARNRAIAEAAGRYIAFLDADDLWLPHKLQRQLEFMEANDLAFTYSGYEVIDEEGRQIATFRPPQSLTYHSLLKTNPIGCLTAIYDTQKLGKTYMPDILKRQDYGLWLRILWHITSARGIMEPLAVYRRRKSSVSSNKLKAALYQWKIYRELEGLGFFKTLYYFVHYAYSGLRKY